MKIKVGQKIRIGKSAKCINALVNFHLSQEDLHPVLGRVAFVKELTTYETAPAVHLNFPGRPTGIRDPNIYFPVSVLRKP